MQYRSEGRKKLTELTVKKQLEALSKLTEGEAVERIEQSIRNGWAGLFEVSAKQTQKSPPSAVNGFTRGKVA